VEDVICRHEEHINCANHIGTCKRCGQQQQYDEYERKINHVIRRGELNGVQTMVKPTTLKEEAKQNKEHEEAQGIPAPPLFAKPENWRELGVNAQHAFLVKSKDVIIQIIDSCKGPQEAKQRLAVAGATLYKLLREFEHKPPWARKPKVKKVRKTTTTDAVENTVEQTEPVTEVENKPAEKPFTTGPMNKRTGTRALWRF